MHLTSVHLIGGCLTGRPSHGYGSHGPISDGRSSHRHATQGHLRVFLACWILRVAGVSMSIPETSKSFRLWATRPPGCPSPLGACLLRVVKSWRKDGPTA